MRKKLLWGAAAIVALLGILVLYVYLALPLIWPVVSSDLRHGDVRGKMYYFTNLAPLKKEAERQEKNGRQNIAANQILREVHWLLITTRDFPRIAERLEDLRLVLRDPALLDAADAQSPEDGSWGRWYTEWFFKVDASYEQIQVLARDGKAPQYPARFLDRINSPEKLRAHFERILISDMARDSRDHGRELNETVSALMRMILRQQPADYPFHPQLKATLLDIIMNRIRDPETGYFVNWFQVGDRLEKRLSLSLTFHIVNFLNGEIPDWPTLIATMLAMKDKEFRVGGWLDNGKYTNHHNMDVVLLFSLGWPHVSPELQDSMRVEIRRMLTWCLQESLLADGSFRPNQFENDSLEECTYFGASFLARAGYFDPKKRFWTNEDFPEADQVKQRLVNNIRARFDSGGASGTYYRNALEQLGEEL
jgi:hypothetical protein